MWYKFSMDMYNVETDETEKITGLLVAPTFSDAMRQVTEDYGDAYVDTVTLSRIESEFNCLALDEILDLICANQEGSALGPQLITALKEAIEDIRKVEE